MDKNKTGRRRPAQFIDLFAGCGGLSLGLMKAGLDGRFGVEREANAFATLSHNLITGKEELGYSWPEWLPQEALSVEDLLESYDGHLKAMRGAVDLLAGGPPCQGFSSIGRRQEDDPRNQAFRQYVKLVKLLRPTAVLIENVRGITMSFQSNGSASGKHTTAEKRPFSRIIKERLEESDLGYRVWAKTLYARDFGVPQTRPRFILLGVLKDRLPEEELDPFQLLASKRESFLNTRGLRSPVTVQQALFDLERTPGRTVDCAETPRFKQGKYGQQKTAYQKLMHGNLNGQVADSHRFTNHRASTIEKFQWFLDNCDRGQILRQEDRGEYKNSKHTVYVLDPGKPAPTVTTLPDDMLHYSEPRILTVREMARLQSFPDSYEFRGKYTTGSTERVKECPRFTQVGNAVPPLLAEALGITIAGLFDKLRPKVQGAG